MTNMIQHFKRFLQKIRDRFSAPLPIGVSEFNAWASRLIDTYRLPDNDSTRFALAVQILHLGPTDANKPARYFSLVTHKGMAAQVASQVMQDIKIKHQELEAKAKAEQDAKATLSLVPSTSEATPISEAASNVHQSV